MTAEYMHKDRLSKGAPRAPVGVVARQATLERHGLLALQRSIGNHAMARYVAAARSATLQRVTVFDKPDPTTHSSSKVGVFGIGPAGWKFLEDEHKSKSRFGWDKSPLTPDTGVYSVETFLEQGWSSIPAASKAALIEEWLNDILCVDPEVKDAKTDVDKGMTLAEILAKHGQDHALKDRTNFLEWAGKHGKHGSPKLAAASAKVGKIETQGTVAQARFESKRGLVDLLQANIERTYRKKKLIPVFLALRKTDSDPSSHFVPNVKVIIDKTTEYTTDREIRMIYKLTEEMPDSEIKAIAKQTFFFQEQDATTPQRTFTTIPRPWDPVEADYSGQSTTTEDNFAPAQQGRWATRTRKGGSDAYAARAATEVPLWIKQLIAFKEQVKKTS